MVHFKTLPNGIRLIVKQMSGLMSVSMGVIVGTGAAVESDAEDGVSHFIEHMMFKGTQKRTAYEISDHMDAIGAQVNAFTGKDVTCYYAKSTTVHAAEAFEILADLFLNSVFPEDEMAREKGVIVEEINMNEDTPDDLCLDMLARAYYGERGYGRNILGTKKNVNGFTLKHVQTYMAERYATDNIVIAMAGNIEPSLAEELAQKYFSSLPATKKVDREIPLDIKSRNLSVRKDIEQVHLAIAYPSLKRYDERLDATQILNTVLGGSMSSRLFQTVREKLGLAYTVYSYVSAYAETGSLTVYAGVNTENLEKAAQAIDKCIAEIRKKNITEEEFLRGKEQLLSSSVFAQESSSSQMLLYGKELIYRNAVYDFEERVNKLNSLKLENVLDCIDYNFDESRRSTAVIGKADKPLKA